MKITPLMNYSVNNSQNQNTLATRPLSMKNKGLQVDTLSFSGVNQKPLKMISEDLVAKLRKISADTREENNSLGKLSSNIKEHLNKRESSEPKLILGKHFPDNNNDLKLAKTQTDELVEKLGHRKSNLLSATIYSHNGMVDEINPSLIPAKEHEIIDLKTEQLDSEIRRFVDKFNSSRYETKNSIKEHFTNWADLITAITKK